MTVNKVGFIKPKQNSVIKTNNMRSVNAFFLATVTQVYPKRGTCDIEIENGVPYKNVPIMFECGLIDNKVYGEFEMPVKNSTVVVLLLGLTGDRPIILNKSFYPYLMDEYNKTQTPVNSDNKQYTKKLLEEGKEKVYRKIFKSGTSIEVQDDGTIIVEIPDGTAITIDADGITMVDSDGNQIATSSSGVTVEDTNGNTINMGTTSVKINDNLEILQ